MKTAIFTLGLLVAAPKDWALEPFVQRPISAPDIDQYKETLLAADIDHDGDLDFFGGEGRGKRSWWFEREAAGWKRRLVSDSDLADVGGALLDVDGDGWIDKVSSGFWYRNPGFPEGGLSPDAADPAFTACRYSGLEYAHDMLTADFDRDGKPDILTIDYDGIRWYRTPPRDSACGPWEEVMINGHTSDPQQHGGIAAGDIDGDGDLDVSRLDRWYENSDGKGRAWTEHTGIPFGDVRDAGWGQSGRARIFDMDRDGRMDIVQTECDAPSGRVAWFGNPEGKGLVWVPHLVKDSTDGQDFHSLILADFDQDGDSDIFSAGAGNSSGTPKAYLWENLDGKGGTWREHVIFDGVQSIHDADGADMDGDGDLDILAKNWNDGAQYYLENQQVPNPGSGLRGRAQAGSARTDRLKPPGARAAYLRKGRYHTADGRQAPRKP